MNVFNRLALTCAALALCATATLQIARADTPIEVPMTADRWQVDGKVEFLRVEGFPSGVMQIGDSTAAAKGMNFANGTIEYDAKLESDGFAAIRFRTQDPESAEIFYLRPDSNCPAADDCIQYVPRVHGVWPWEMYPEYQAQAPVVIGGWNHVRLVVSGRRMNIFINRATSPTLVVGDFEGDALAGGLEIAGPAEFANLTVTAGEIGGLPSTPSQDPTSGDGRLVRHWEVSKPSVLPYGVSPSLAQMPSDSAAWSPIDAERHGLVNLSRRYGSPTDASTGAVVWLKTEIDSDRDQTKPASFGFLHEAWVFVNGKPVFSGENLYYPDSKRLTPDGRISLDNSSFALPLRKGANEIAIALNNILAVGHHHYGWGVEMRLANLDGLGSSAPNPGKAGLQTVTFRHHAGRLR